MCQGAVTINKDSITRNIAYYSVAHASKFVRPGSVRIASNEIDSISNAAFKTPEGKYVLIVSNNSDAPQHFNIKFRGKTAQAKIDGGSVATYVW